MSSNSNNEEASDKKRKIMQLSRSFKESQNIERRRNFRMLVILLDASGFTFEVDTSHDPMLRHYYNFTTNPITSVDFIAQITNAEDPPPLFNWTQNTDGGHKIEIQSGINSLWSYILMSLLQTGTISPSLEIDPTFFSNIVNKDIIGKLRFTKASSLKQVAMDDNMEVKDTIASAIGASFDMVVLCGCHAFESCGNGKLSGSMEAVYSFIAAKVMVRYQVSVYPPLSMIHFIHQKVTQRNKLFKREGNLLVPSVVLVTNEVQSWNDVAGEALFKLSNLDHNNLDLKELGMVAKVEYSAAGLGVFFLDFNNITQTWICTKASDSLPKHPIELAPMNCHVQVEPKFQFIIDKELRVYVSPSSNSGSQKVRDLYYVETSLRPEGTLDYEIMDDGLNSVLPKTERVNYTAIKKKAILALTEGNSNNWARALKHSILRVDMSLDKTGIAGPKGRAYLIEVELFPCASTFLISTSDDLRHVIKFAAASYFHFSYCLSDGNYFCN